MLKLLEIARGRVVVLGVGNTLKADDGAGPLVAAALRERYPGVVFDAGQAPENFVAPVRRARPDTIIVVDAADFGATAGEMRIASADDVEGLALGTHSAPLSMFMDAISSETGADVHLVAIQVKTTELGGPMSDEVSRAVDCLVPELETLLKAEVDA